MTEHRPFARAPWALLMLALVVSSCASARDKRDREIAEADLGPIPSGEILIQQDTSIGKFLTDLDNLMARYFKYSTLNSASARQKQDAIEIELERAVRAREDELVFELRQGATRNRGIAAAALGFSPTEFALGPLIVALDDPSEQVHRHATLGLALLADPATPIDLLTEILRTDQDAIARNNAALGLFRLVRKDARDPELAPALRRALLDEEASIRAQAAITLGVLVDTESVEELATLLDDEPFVYSAASRALFQIERDAPEYRGDVARAFLAAWKAAEDDRKGRLRRDLTQLAGKDQGKREEDWERWAYGLP